MNFSYTVASCWSFYKKSIMMHGTMNVKFVLLNLWALYGVVFKTLWRDAGDKQPVRCHVSVGFLF